MELFESILNRASARKFKPEQVSKDDLTKIVQAGARCPTAMNIRAIHFTVVTNKQKLTELNEAVKTVLNQSTIQRLKSRASDSDYSFFYKAPALIIVSASDESIFPREDCACAMQNMMLACTALDLGSCWINQLGNGNSEQQVVRNVLDQLGVPKGNKAYAALAVGKADGEVPPKQKEVSVNFC